MPGWRLRELPVDGVTGQLTGTVEPEFEPVLDAFISNVKELGEVGGAVACYINGEPVLNFWGGFTDAERVKPWKEDTLACTMSISKGIVALCAHMQIYRGLLKLDAPVAHYWPAFGQAGKESITVRHVLSHQAALPVADSAPAQAALLWDPLIRALEVQEPIWAPGTKATYHSITYGHLVGELVQRTSGKSLPRFIREELSEPLRAEFILQVDDAEASRVAPPVANPKNRFMAPNPDPLAIELLQRQLRLLVRLPGQLPPTDQIVRALFASGGGVTNANGLARIFAALACGGELGTARIMDQATIAQATEQHSWEPDPIHGNAFRLALGFLLNEGEWPYFGPNPDSFGTAGQGGYFAFVDPARKMSFSFTPARWVNGHACGEEARRLIDALYAVL